ncbi:hypothetical protein RAJCM14343_5241 [Rhodococcus aetherivorans]|uniref:Uncharacterized protein n=1 Tax=Rhodococcus aetherivorans TaxID=191292 RepID=A0ABQ0YTI5_9NOCA|nr:hypothetical protein RAJCM14343_5241 [Rhodococcus aetherivorans]
MLGRFTVGVPEDRRDRSGGPSRSGGSEAAALRKHRSLELSSLPPA